MLRFVPLRPLALARVLALLCVAAAPASAAPSKAFVFGTDYTTGSLTGYDLPARSAHCDAASPNSDASLRFFAGRLYVVNRFGGDNIQVVNPATYGTVLQFSVGNGANPHDIALVSPTKAYVTRYESADLWIVNPQTGAHTGTVSLAAFADADGLPEMDRLALVGDLLFVAIERIDRPGGYVPSGPGLVAVIDTRTDALVDCDPALPGTQAIALQLANPVTTFQFDAATRRLLVGCAGTYGVLDGGLEWIDTNTLRSAGVAIGEGTLGGDVSDVVWVGPAKSYAIVADLAFNTSLVSWSAAGAVLDTLWAPGGYSLSDAEANDAGELWVCRNSFSGSALRVYTIATDVPSGPDLHCTLPPVAVAFDAVGTTGVAPEAATFAFAPVWPNPARGAVRFAATLPAAAGARLELFDAAGRRVRTLADGTFAAGAHAWSWDLRDEGGARVAPGVYAARLAVAGASRTRRVVVTGR